MTLISSSLSTPLTGSCRAAERLPFAAVVDERVAVAVGVGLVVSLVVGGDLKSEGFAVLEGVGEADAGDAADGEGEDAALFAAAAPTGIVGGGAVDLADGAVGKRFGVEAGGFFGVVGVPEAEGGFVHFALLWLGETGESGWRFLETPTNKIGTARRTDRGSPT